MLALLIVVALVYGFYQVHESQQNPELSTLPESTAYQTGKAFEIIEPEAPVNQSSGKTPEALIAEGDQIILGANKIIEKYGLSQDQMTATQKKEVTGRVALIEQEITRLEQQLQ